VADFPESIRQKGAEALAVGGFRPTRSVTQVPRACPWGSIFFFEPSQTLLRRQTFGFVEKEKKGVMVYSKTLPLLCKEGAGGR
jgi:hypothetical protein